MRPEGSATSWQSVRAHLREVHRHEVIVVLAMLVCSAVILNVGPFAKTSSRQADPVNGQTSSAQPPHAHPWVIADRMPETDDGVRPEATRSITLAPVVSAASDPVAPPPDEPAREAAQAQSDAPPATPVAQPVQLVTTPNAQTAEIAADHEAIAEAMTPAGIWAPNATACSLRDLRDGLLPTIIDTDGARAGDTLCTFKNRKQTENGWRVIAHCADAREHWTAVVHLTVKDRQLIWASNRGRQVYTRCAPDAVKTAAR